MAGRLADLFQRTIDTAAGYCCCRSLRGQPLVRNLDALRHVSRPPSLLEGHRFARMADGPRKSRCQSSTSALWAPETVGLAQTPFGSAGPKTTKTLSERRPRQRSASPEQVPHRDRKHLERVESPPKAHSGSGGGTLYAPCAFEMVWTDSSYRRDLDATKTRLHLLRRARLTDGRPIEPSCRCLAYQP